MRGLSLGGPCYDVFVAKWNPSGTRLLWATYLGGSGDDDLGGMAVDQSGNVYLTGWTSSADFPVTTGAVQTQYLGAKFVGNSYEFIGDAFAVKLNSSGTALVYSTYLGGTGSDWANAIAIDNAGNAYITGATTSKDFPVSAAAFQQTNHTATLTGTNAFVTKLNAAGSAIVYSTYLGGSVRDSGGAIATDSTGVAYLSGSTISPDFPIIPGAYQTSLRDTLGSFIGGGDTFVTRLNVSRPGGAKAVLVPSWPWRLRSLLICSFPSHPFSCVYRGHRRAAGLQGAILFLCREFLSPLGPCPMPFGRFRFHQGARNNTGA